MSIIDRINAFLEWWTAGLTAILPRRWQHARRLRGPWILITAQDSGYLVSLQNGTRTEITSSFSSETADGASAQRLPGALQKALSSGRAPVVLRVPADQVLVRQLQFPLAVRPELARAVGYEIERQTPFRSDDVYMGFTAGPADGETLPVTLVVARKAQLDTAVGELRKRGLAVTIAEVEGCEFAQTGLNLLHSGHADRAQAPHLRRVILALACLALLLVGPIRGTIDIEADIDRLGIVERERRAALKTLRPLREKLERVSHEASFMRDRESAYVPSLEVLREITRVLPDNSWVHRFELKNGYLNLQGESLEAAALPQLIETSSLFSEPRFSAPLTRNPTTGAERFTLIAKISR